jgi:hypothetical protein
LSSLRIQIKAGWARYRSQSHIAEGIDDNGDDIGEIGVSALKMLDGFFEAFDQGIGGFVCIKRALKLCLRVVEKPLTAFISRLDLIEFSLKALE